jgi:hypothetical protein
MRMRNRHSGCWVVVVLLLVLLAPGTGRAGPYIGDWGWCWHPAKDCQPWEYSWLHYWARDLFILRACVHPSYLDQYAPGVPVPIGFLDLPYKCRSIPPAPTPPYAEPESYYGIPLVPPSQDSKDSKTEEVKKESK